MGKYIDKEAAYDYATLYDWYIASVTDDTPVWTEEHLEELLNDFNVIPKDTPATDAVSRETYEAVVKALQALAETDVVEVIRCGKCRHHLTRSGRCVKNEGIFSVSDFCSKGELK